MNFFLDTTKRCTKEISSSLPESELGNKSLKCEKVKKTNVLNLDLGQKIASSFFRKLRACATGDIFFGYSLKMH